MYVDFVIEEHQKSIDVTNHIRTNSVNEKLKLMTEKIDTIQQTMAREINNITQNLIPDSMQTLMDQVIKHTLDNNTYINERFYQALKTELNTFKDRLTKLDSDIKSRDATMRGLRSDLTAVDNRLKNLSESLMTEKIDTIQQTMAREINNITQNLIPDSMQTLMDQVIKHTLDNNTYINERFYQALKTELNTFKDRLTKLDSDIKSRDATMRGLRSDLTAVDNRLKNLSESVRAIPLKH
ncbi:hypothetical protein FQR65_LT18240 [Abscondita terminalis]|nr:hypothetical protein FQR65_LT18240 [Abscondita terminalis]